ncbi:hypothetical protein ACFYUR_22135 [Micromonospora haikouensis]|uniref:hypothetical protein n=1 Tax=Micromonospora haikouensis TaxID=686309 RepID=UPI00369BCA74
MTIDFYAGMVPTADELLALAPGYVAQSISQAVSSATTGATLVDSAIVVPVAGLSVVDLSARYTSLAGGIQWAWRVTGTVTLAARDIMSAGQAATTTAGTANIDYLRWRQIATVGEAQVSAHFDTASTQLIRERLLCDGVGTIIFQFAQATSNASATTLNAASYATVAQVRQL